MKIFGIAVGAAVALALIVGGAMRWIINPGVVRELREEPDGERAKKVMLLTLPSGKAIPVNYLREGNSVYAAADFPWWYELKGGGGKGSVLIRGEELRGHMRAVVDDPPFREAVFGRLRPTAPLFFGTLIVIELD